MKNKIIGIALVFLLCALLVLPGCRKETSDDKVSITLLHGWGSHTQDHVTMREIYADFTKERPNIRLEFEAYPEGAIALDKASDQLATDSMPNIVSTNGHRYFVDAAVKKGKAVDFSTYLSEDPEFQSDISQYTLDFWSNDAGEIFTIPDAQEIAGYWYNEDILRKAGVTDTGDATGTVVLPTSWDAFWENWVKIDDWGSRQVTQVRPAVFTDYQSILLLAAQIAGSGTEGLAFMQQKEQSLSRDTFMAMLEQTDRLSMDYSVPSLGDREVREKFLNGEVAFYFNGVWANTSLFQGSNHSFVQYAAYPAVDGETLAFITPSSGYVVSNTGSPEEIAAAVSFVKYMVSEEVQQRIVLETKQAPSNPKVDAAWISEREPNLGNALQVCYDADYAIVAFSTLLEDSAHLMLVEHYSGDVPTIDSAENLYSIITHNNE